jgi:Domain of unknown function (DUF4386)
MGALRLVAGYRRWLAPRFGWWHYASARVFGVLYLITFITSIPAFFFYAPVLDDPRFVLGGGGDTSVAFGALLELLLIIANIGTAVVPFPIFRRQNEILALGYDTARIVECTFIAVGILSLLTAVALRQEAAAGADAAWLLTAGKALVALHEWTRQLGPGFVVGVGNGLILGYLMYKSALGPRPMAVLGLVGGPLIIASGLGVLFGVIEAGGVVQGIATIPEFLWGISLGIWPIVRGFDPSAIARLQHEAQ